MTLIRHPPRTFSASVRVWLILQAARISPYYSRCTSKQCLYHPARHHRYNATSKRCRRRF